MVRRKLNAAIFLTVKPGFPGDPPELAVERNHGSLANLSGEYSRFLAFAQGKRDEPPG
jgi:hypothetical protein